MPKLNLAILNLNKSISENIKAELDKKFYRKWACNKALKLKDKLSNIDLTKKLSIIDKLRFVLQYGLFDIRAINTYRKSLMLISIINSMNYILVNFKTK